MVTTEFQVTGMSCGHCESAVRAEVEQIPGVSAIEVGATTGHLSVTINPDVTDIAAITAAVLSAVDEAGYSAELR